MKLLDVVEVEDDPHLKHRKSMCKSPLHGAPIVGGIDCSNVDQRISRTETYNSSGIGDLHLVESRSLILYARCLRGVDD